MWISREKENWIYANEIPQMTYSTCKWKAVTDLLRINIILFILWWILLCGLIRSIGRVSYYCTRGKKSSWHKSKEIWKPYSCFSYTHTQRGTHTKRSMLVMVHVNELTHANVSTVTSTDIKLDFALPNQINANDGNKCVTHFLTGYAGLIHISSLLNTRNQHY